MFDHPTNPNLELEGSGKGPIYQDKHHLGMAGSCQPEIESRIPG